MLTDDTSTPKRIGRPEIGPAILVRLGPDLLAKLDRFARSSGQPRAAAVRQLLGEAFEYRSRLDATRGQLREALLLETTKAWRARRKQAARRHAPGDPLFEMQFTDRERTEVEQLVEQIMADRLGR